MKVSKKIIGGLILMNIAMLSSTITFAAYESKSTALLSYSDWKSQTRHDIQKKVQQLEQKLSDQRESTTVKSTSISVSKPDRRQNEDNLQAQLRFEKVKLEASEDLSFHEYFLSYLSEQKDFEQKVAELAKVLRPEEIRELISSYNDLVKKKKRDGQHGYNTSPIDD